MSQFNIELTTLDPLHKSYELLYDVTLGMNFYNL